MTRFSLLLVLVSHVWVADPPGDVLLGRGWAHVSLPLFHHGYLTFIVNTRSFEVWGPDGRLRCFVAMERPEDLSIMGVAVDSGGSIAASYASRTASGIEAGIAYFDSNGTRTRTVETGKYMPAHLAFDGNQNLWAFGWQRDSSGEYEERRDYMMLRKYSPAGHEKGRFGRRALLPRGGLTPGGPSRGLARLHVAKDRIGAIAFYGDTSEITAWIELGLDGHVISQWRLGDSNGGLAFAQDARLFRVVVERTTRLEVFDRASAEWRNAGGMTPQGFLLGVQNGQLVFGRDDGVVRITSADVPKLQKHR
ncbi:MAG: hypothetical protein ABI823_01900 [Bryobacteraceae bacterium]